MRAKQIVVVIVATLLTATAAAAAGGAGSRSHGGADAAVRVTPAPHAVGTWIWSTYVSEGTALTGLVTYHADGTVAYYDASLFGAAPGVPLRVGAFQGAWVHLPARQFAGTAIALLFDPQSGAVVGYGRSRSELVLVDRDHFQGFVVMDMLYCADPLHCPDPTDPAAIWMPWGPPQGFPVTGVRVRRVPALPDVQDP